MNKQIEEMAKVLTEYENCGNCENCKFHGICDEERKATNLYNAGYRKIPTNDWLTKGISEEQLEQEKQEALDEFAKRNGYCKVSEIFEEIERLLDNHHSACHPIGAIEAYTYYEGGLGDAIAELKKKYESEGVY